MSKKQVTENDLEKWSKGQFHLLDFVNWSQFLLILRAEIGQTILSQFSLLFSSLEKTRPGFPLKELGTFALFKLSAFVVGNLFI